MVTTDTSTISAEIRQHYDKTMLHYAIPELVYSRWSMKKTIPAGEGVVVNWRRASLLPVATTPLTEGVTPTAATMTVTNIAVTVLQYGNWVPFSDKVTVTSIDDILLANAELLGQNAGNTFDQIARDVFAAGTSVQYANGRVSRVTVAAGDIINDVEIKKMRRALKRLNARWIPGLNAYVAVAHPDTFLDLQGTDAFKLTGFYQDKQRIYDGEIIKLYGIMFVETTNAKIFSAAGAAGIDVYATIVMGAEATAVVDIEKLGLETIYMPPGSGGTNDPLKQRQTQAWKGSYAAAILNQDWLLRVEHATTA